VTDALTYSISQVATAFEVPVSTLRYYDELGLVPSTSRRSRVRHYDVAALRRLAYIQLWRLDGMLSIEHTTEIVASLGRQHRNELLARSRDELDDRIRRLTEARDMLTHMMRCPIDDHLTCPVIGTYLAQRVDLALNHLAGRPASREAAPRTLARLAHDLLGAPDPDADSPEPYDEATIHARHAAALLPRPDPTTPF
jgi:DNA-binding transcriptional MerR regulator